MRTANYRKLERDEQEHLQRLTLMRPLDEAELLRQA